MSFGFRLRAATCAGVLALGALLSAPAQAAAAAPIRVETDDLVLGAGSTGKVTSVDVYNTTGADQVLRNFTVTVDTVGLAGKATVKNRLNDRCTTSGTVLTCVTASVNLPAGTLPEYVLFLDVIPTAQAAVGDKLALKVGVSAEGLPKQEATGTVTIAESIDLTTARDMTRTGKPGGTVTFPLAVRNASRIPARGVVLSHSRSTENVEYDRKYSNCIYTADQMACVFPEELAAGKEYELAGAIVTKVRADAPAPMKYDTYFEWQTRDDAAEYLERLRAQRATAGAGAPLRLTEKTSAARVQGQTEVKPIDNFAKVAVTIEGNNAADQVAVGGVVRGAVGSTVVAKVGIRNAGPARADYDRDDIHKLSGIHLLVPSNASVVSAPTNQCVAAKDGKRIEGNENPVGARELLCWDGFTIEVGQTVTWDIGLRVDTPQGTAGAVIVAPKEIEGEPTLDRDASNNRAELVVALPLPPAKGAGAAGGGTGGSTDGGLPVTGAEVGTFAAAGVALVAAGVAGFVLARRRTRFTA